jgi:hypothetical protein
VTAGRPWVTQVLGRRRRGGGGEVPVLPGRKDRLLAPIGPLVYGGRFHA